ncbi:hypothetical protein [Nesterenkonia ebinurensis]|uniref:hypothetical protein n=1 Tax=Nesterenkonia ebinurensis TaxID=2608252 RepID=UPI00168B3280|nr:hypothetical protein [Nesterenkonia ebinurensis]
MANRAISIVITILLVIVVLWVALWLLEVALGIFGNLILAALVVLGILYLIRLFTSSRA